MEDSKIDLIAAATLLNMSYWDVLKAFRNGQIDGTNVNDRQCFYKSSVLKYRDERERGAMEDHNQSRPFTTNEASRSDTYARTSGTSEVERRRLPCTRSAKSCSV